VCSGALPSRLDLKTLFDQQLLVAAVIDGGTEFKLITAANLRELPRRAVARN
jgi:hypothetical protein